MVFSCSTVYGCNNFCYLMMITSLDFLPAIEGCRRCPLWQTATQTVVGEGFDHPKILLLGEAPGKTEDIVGLPFRGPAGSLLRETLLEAGIPPEWVFFDNSVRHRPDGNRKPTVAERKACLPWTVLTIEHLNPDVIVTCGESALQSLLPGSKISLLHGRTAEYRGKTLFATYHPAACLHNPTMLPKFRGDIMALSDFLELRPKHPLPDYGKYSEPLLDNKIAAIDIETDARWEGETSLVSAAFSVQEGQARWVTPESIDQLPQSAVVVMHNAKYDQPILARHGVYINPDIVEDTMLMAYVLRYPRLGLKYLVQSEFGHRMTELSELTGTGVGRLSPAEVDLTQLGEYNCSDADWTRRLYLCLLEKLETEPGLQWVYENIERPLWPVVADMEKTGVLVDVERLNRIREEKDEESNLLVSRLRSITGHPINWRSTPQMLQLLRGYHLDFPDTTERTLIGFRDGPITGAPREVITTLLALRKRGALVKYLRGIPSSTQADGRVHGSFNQTGTESGRFSSSRPNLQNIPHLTGGEDDIGLALRSCFIAPEGKLLVVGDQSQIELRLNAYLSQDVQLLSDLASSDIHRETARKMFSILSGRELKLSEVTSNQRYQGKILNFNIWYGGQPFGIAQLMNDSRPEGSPPITVQQAGLLMKAYPYIDSVRAYFAEVGERLSRYGYVETLSGRRNYYPKWESPRYDERQASLREALNMITQGTSADILKLALRRVYDDLRRNQLDAHIVMTIHDEIIIESSADSAEFVSTILKEALEETPSVLGIDIPCPTEVGIGPTWASAKP